MKSFFARLFEKGSPPASDSPRTDGVFAPREWNPFLTGLEPTVLRQAAHAVCQALIQQTGLASGILPTALDGLDQRQADPSLLQAAERLLADCEQEYDGLLIAEEAGKGPRDPMVDTTFNRARAASALLFALRGEHREMAYEAGTVLGDAAVLQMFQDFIKTERNNS